MIGEELFVLCGLILLVAILYSAAGQAGATGYLAVMALMGVAPQVMKPTALVLNVLVAAFSTYRFHRAGLLDWRSASPLLLASLPTAFVGGVIQLSDEWFRYLVGALLIVAGVVLLLRTRSSDITHAGRMPVFAAVAIGGLVGLLSGLTGSGGGIVLAPILLAFTWANVRSISGLTAPFNLLNSSAALAGNVIAIQGIPGEMPYFVLAALAGAGIGTRIALAWLSVATLQRLLALLLLVAGAKFLMS